MELAHTFRHHSRFELLVAALLGSCCSPWVPGWRIGTGVLAEDNIKHLGRWHAAEHRHPTKQVLLLYALGVPLLPAERSKQPPTAWDYPAFKVVLRAKRETWLVDGTLCASLQYIPLFTVPAFFSILFRWAERCTSMLVRQYLQFASMVDHGKQQLPGVLNYQEQKQRYGRYVGATSKGAETGTVKELLTLEIDTRSSEFTITNLHGSYVYFWLFLFK